MAAGHISSYKWREHLHGPSASCRGEALPAVLAKLLQGQAQVALLFARGLVGRLQGPSLVGPGGSTLGPAMCEITCSRHPIRFDDCPAGRRPSRSYAMGRPLPRTPARTTITATNRDQHSPSFAVWLNRAHASPLRSPHDCVFPIAFSPAMRCARPSPAAARYRFHASAPGAQPVGADSVRSGSLAPCPATGRTRV